MNGKTLYWLLGAVFAVLMMLSNIQLSQIHQGQQRLEDRVAALEKAQAIVQTLLSERTRRSGVGSE